MEANAERTLNNLHVLGALSHNDKLMTNEDTFDIYSPTSMRGLVRMWYGERRISNIARVRQCIRTAIAFATQLHEETNVLLNNSSPTSSTGQMKMRVDTHSMQFLRMVDGLNRAKGGLHNLLQTYRDDAANAAQVQLLIEEIDDYIYVMQPHTRVVGQSRVMLGTRAPPECLEEGT